LLNKWHKITAESGFASSIKHNITHQIITTGNPVVSKVRKLSTEKMLAAKQEFDFLIREGICRPSNSPWSSPLHLVKRKDGRWRPCGDYRRLYAITRSNRYPIPLLHDFAHQLHGCQVFSTLDLTKAYHQLPIEPDDIPKTAICTPFGLFEFTRMTFGLCNAAQTFQRFINWVLRDLAFCFVYIDDVLIASKSEEEHLTHLEQIFQRFEENGLVINLEKCHFLKSELNFLGHLISSEGIKPASDKVAAINNFKRPENVKDLRRFLGMINFYRRFLPKAAKHQLLLNEYLKGNKKDGSKKINWDSNSIESFETVKKELCIATLLAFPDPLAKLALFVDASNTAIGAAIQQFVNNSWQPLAFFSVKLNSAQRKYSTYDRELLAIYQSIKYFRHNLEGRNFTIFTDHKPLIFAFRQNLDKASPRQFRHLDFISQFSTDIQHISGSHNVVADTLSRVDEIKCSPTLDFEAIAKAQLSDEVFKEFLKEKKFIFQKSPIFGSKIQIYCENSSNRLRPYIPKDFRYQVFKSVHDIAHPGIRSTNKLLTSKFFWPSINKDSNEWSRACLSCQKSKITRHVKNPPNLFEPVSKRFHVIHIDIVGPLPVSQGFRYCLSIIDRFTRWPEAIPLSNCTAETCAEAICREWIARFGVPRSIITDQGRQFESDLFRELAKIMGFKRNRTTAYHPQSNGFIERWHRTLKTTLLTYNCQSWSQALPFVLLGLRTAVREEFSATPAELVYGEPIRLPGDFLLESQKDCYQSEFINKLRELFSKLRPVPASNHSLDKSFKFKELDSCSHVFVRANFTKSLQHPYDGPYPVITRKTNYFTVKINNREVNISIERLKPCYITQNETISEKKSIKKVRFSL